MNSSAGLLFHVLNQKIREMVYVKVAVFVNSVCLSLSNAALLAHAVEIKLSRKGKEGITGGGIGEGGFEGIILKLVY
jgi:hypothetical protein